MKRLLLFLLFAFSVQAQTVVTGYISNSTGGPATKGYVEFTIMPQSSAIWYTVPGTATIAPQTARCGINGSGQVKNLALTGNCLVWGNDVISPGNTTYKVTFAPDNVVRNTISQVSITGATYSLNSPVFAPIVSIVPQYQTITTSPISVNLIPAAPHAFNVGSAGIPYAAGYFDNLFMNGLPVTSYPVTAIVSCDSASLSSAIASPGTVDLRPCEGQTIVLASDVTITNSVYLIFGQGPILAPAVTKTLTLQADFEAPLSQIFGGAGTVAFTNGKKSTFNPEWWGALPDNSTNSAAAINAAIAAAQTHSSGGLSGGVVLLQTGMYFTGTTTLTSSSYFVLRGVAANHRSFIRYAGTGTALDITGAQVYGIAIENVQIACTTAITCAKGIAVSKLNEARWVNFGIGGFSTAGLTGFTHGLYLEGGSGDLTFTKAIITDSVNGITSDIKATVGGNADITFDGLILFNNQNPLNMKSMQSWTIKNSIIEWYETAIKLDNDATATFNGHGMIVESSVFDNVRFLNGPTSPYQSAYFSRILASNGARSVQVRGITFRDCWGNHNTAIAGTVVASPFVIDLSGASAVTADLPITFTGNNFFNGGSTTFFDNDTAAVVLNSENAKFSNDLVLGGTEFSTDATIFGGAGGGTRTRVTAISRTFYSPLVNVTHTSAPILRVTGPTVGSGSALIEFYRGAARTAYIGAPNSASNSFNIVMDPANNAPLYLQGHASNSVRIITSALVGIGKADFTPTASLHVKDATASTGITTLKCEEGAGQSTTPCLDTHSLIVNSTTKLNGSVSQGTAFKFASVTTGSIAGASSAAVTLTFSGVFTNSAWMPTCSLLEATTTTSTIRIHHIESITNTTNATVVVRIVNDDAVTAKTGTLYCTGVSGP